MFETMEEDDEDWREVPLPISKPIGTPTQAMPISKLSGTPTRAMPISKLSGTPTRVKLASKPSGTPTRGAGSRNDQSRSTEVS